ncbi:S-adenosyl-L-methionine-dependent methyltransferase [Gigaspora rosea]|uniref:S-adenosyl-L-methionine-dependent methyltransferase n=1 Tax=Gigaspora rosea TaxID=44941 RepID=A0A397USK9_9GLOM|nr:S-adenosyl-L-methionine-dependent methyltransferase [Gigaspora rosea]
MDNEISKNQSKGASDLSNENTFKIVDGRKYHNENNSIYFLPSDNEEIDRLHLQHYMQKNIYQRNFFAPVEHLLKQEGAKVLDVGTGAGSWLFEMAADYPKAKFIGVDISPIHSSHIKPNNAEIIKGNVVERLPFDDNTFDYVFQRFLSPGIPENKWPFVINELVRVVRPGGFLEVLDCEYKASTMGPATTKILDAVFVMFQEFGLDPNVCYKLQNYLKENEQLHDVHCEIKKEIDTKDAEELYKLYSKNYVIATKGFKSKLMSIMKISNDEFDNLVEKMGEEYVKLKTFSPQVRVYAQKKTNYCDNLKFL